MVYDAERAPRAHSLPVVWFDADVSGHLDRRVQRACADPLFRAYRPTGMEHALNFLLAWLRLRRRGLVVLIIWMRCLTASHLRLRRSVSFAGRSVPCIGAAPCGCVRRRLSGAVGAKRWLFTASELFTWEGVAMDHERVNWTADERDFWETGHDRGCGLRSFRAGALSLDTDRVGRRLRQRAWDAEMTRAVAAGATCPSAAGRSACQIIDPTARTRSELRGEIANASKVILRTLTCFGVRVDF